MRPRLLVLALAAALIAPLASAPAQERTAPRQRDWTQVVTATAEGGFRMGNPRAPVKVVEYLSLTCPHCASFAEEGAPGLMNYVRSGRVSLEYRNFVLNGLDLAAALLSRCAAPQNYFALNHAILASQAQWMGRVEAMSVAQRQEMQGLNDLQRLRRVAAIAGLDAIAARHGVTPAQADTCMADQARLDRVIQMREAAGRYGVTGTPTFAINGRIAGSAGTWATLEPLLRGR